MKVVLESQADYVVLADIGARQVLGPLSHAGKWNLQGVGRDKDHALSTGFQWTWQNGIE